MHYGSSSQHWLALHMVLYSCVTRATREERGVQKKEKQEIKKERNTKKRKELRNEQDEIEE